MTWLIKTGKAV